MSLEYMLVYEKRIDPTLEYMVDQGKKWIGATLEYKLVQEK